MKTIGQLKAALSKFPDDCLLKARIGDEADGLIYSVLPDTDGKIAIWIGNIVEDYP